MASNRRVLTDSFLRSVEPSGIRYEIWDHGYPGFGIRVGVRGDVAFQYMYRIAGRSRRLAFGKYPGMSLHEARELYRKATIAVSEGSDPAEAKRTIEEAKRTAITVQVLCAEYIQRYAMLRKRTWQEDQRQLNRDVVPALGQRAAKDVTRKDINRLLDCKMDAGSPVAANRLLAVLSKVFGWAVERGEIDVSPCTGIKKPAKESSRERVLQQIEMPALWYALDTGTGIGMHVVTRRALQVMLLTGQRKGEVLRMKWADLEDTVTGWVWTIPAENAKNGRAHRVPLPSEVMVVLETLRPNEGTPEAKTASTWCFPSPKKLDQHISLTAPDHALRDELQRPDSSLHGATRFTPHDFRRTVATGLSVLGYPRLIVQKVLNHADTSVTSIYDRYSYEKEKREALTKWAEMLLAATWPAAQDIYNATGKPEYEWDYQNEWDRMKF